MKKWLVVGCLLVLGFGLIIAAALGWFFFTPSGRLVQTEMACRSGNGAACQSAGEAHRAKGGPASEARSLGFVAKACALDLDVACSEMARATLFGNGLTLAPIEGHAFLERACESGAFRRRLPAPLGLLACRRLGQAFASGQGLARNAKRASEVLDTGCGDGDALSCGALARQVAEGAAGSVDPERARVLHRMACHLTNSGDRLPLLLRVELSGWTLNGTHGTEEEIALRIRDILMVRPEKKVHVFWAKEVTGLGLAGFERIAAATASAEAAGADPIALLGEYDEYGAAVAASCAAVGEAWSGFLPPPPPPPPGG